MPILRKIYVLKVKKKKDIEELLLEDPCIEKIIEFKSTAVDIGKYRIYVAVEWNGTPLYEEIYEAGDLKEEFDDIKDDFKALNDLSRKLKDGGYFLIYVPAFQLLYSSMDIKVGHYRRYRRYPLERLLKRAGFIVVQSRYVDSLGFFATLVFKVIGSEVGDISIKNVTFYDKYLFPISLFLDYFFNRFFGKNVLVLCKKNEQAHHG
jgi:hypothetical protein